MGPPSQCTAPLVCSVQMVCCNDTCSGGPNVCKSCTVAGMEGMCVANPAKVGMACGAIPGNVCRADGTCGAPMDAGMPDGGMDAGMPDGAMDAATDLPVADAPIDVAPQDMAPAMDMGVRPDAPPADAGRRDGGDGGDGAAGELPNTGCFSCDQAGSTTSHVVGSLLLALAFAGGLLLMSRRRAR
jgi:hypothetical protein